MAVVVRRKIQTVCPNERCRHKHAQGEPCHVFVPIWKWEDQESSESESSTESEPDTPSDMDEEEAKRTQEELLREEMEAAKASGDFDGPTMKEMAGAGAKALLAGAKKGLKMAKHGVHTAKMTIKRAKGDARGKLSTPWWAKKNFRRCNCDYGVPNNDVNFHPVPPNRFVGNICINIGECAEVPPFKKQLNPPVEVLRGALPFLNARSIAHAARVCPLWAPEANQQPHYNDMHYCDVVATQPAHDKAVQCVMQYKGRCFTCGDNRVKVWQMAPDLRAEQVHTCAQDTCPVTCCFEFDNMLYTGAANGAVREWSLPYTVTKIEFRSSMWEHNAIINDMAHWKMGGRSHLLTACDDRCCRVWDLE